VPRANAVARPAGFSPARPRGFQRGAAHPSVLRAAYVSRKKARRTEAARRRAAAARAQFKALLEEGIEVAPRTLHTWMKLLNVHTRATNNYADLDERLMHGLLNHVESLKAALARGELGHEHLAYADQTPIWLHGGHNTALSDTVVFGNAGDAKGGKKIGTVWAVVTSQGCLRAWFTEENGDELATKDFFLSDTPPPGWINLHGRDGNIFDVLAAHGRQLRGRRKKMLLLIDRLGKSGASVYPVAGHHTPVLRVRARRAGIGLLMLPPKGALVNPIELWNMHVKTVMNAMQPAGAPRDGWEQLIRGPRYKTEALKMLTHAIIDVDAKPALLRWCYHMRATSADALRRLEGNTEFQAVRAARAAQPVAPFDVDVAADAPRARMATDHAYPRSAVTAETYNVYFWLHHHFGLHEGLAAALCAARGCGRRLRALVPAVQAHHESRQVALAAGRVLRQLPRRLPPRVPRVGGHAGGCVVMRRLRSGRRGSAAHVEGAARGPCCARDDAQAAAGRSGLRQRRRVSAPHAIARTDVLRHPCAKVKVQPRSTAQQHPARPRARCGAAARGRQGAPTQLGLDPESRLRAPNQV
jgi:hypothetical protein